MAILYFWQTRDEDEPPVIPARVPLYLIRRQETELQSVTFRHNGEVIFIQPEIAADGGVLWVLSGADEYLLNPILIRNKALQGWSLTASAAAHEDTAHLNLTDFGLNPPLLTMSAQFDDITHDVRLGMQTADFAHHFVMIDDDPIMYLISSFFAARMLAGIPDMLDTRLPPFDIQLTQYLRLAQRGEDPIEIGIYDGTNLAMFAPRSGMTLNHSVVIRHVFEPLATLRIGELIDIHPTDLSPFGLDAPFLEIEYRGLAGDTHLIFGDATLHEGIMHIYVKFAERPHVFAMELQRVRPLLDIHPLSLVLRHIALVDIRDVERVTVEAHDSDINFILAPFTINNTHVGETVFRQVYMMLISLSADAETAPFMPEGTPYIIITYYRIDNPDTVVRLYEYDANFLAISLDGGEVWSLINRRAVGLLIDHLHSLTID
jgi:hypothetical protein